MLSTPIRSIARRNVTERKFAILFIFLLAYLILYPYAQNTRLPFLAFRIFGTVITVLSVYAVSFRHRLALFAILLGAPVLVQRILLPRANAGALPITGILLSLCFDVFVVVVIFRRVFLRNELTKETIFGALSIYLLVGFSFATLYTMIDTIQVHAFHLDPALSEHATLDRFDLIYYSFATLTCLGAAGITARSAQAQSFSVIEALFGILYLAVLISRLLNAYHTRNAEPPTADTN